MCEVMRYDLDRDTDESCADIVPVDGGRFVESVDFDRVTAERNALQLLLNERDDLDDQLTSLEQRRHAEQQTCQAAERRVEELEGWLLEARRCVLECVDDEAGGPTRTEAQAILSGVDATLTPTAEAVSHE